MSVKKPQLASAIRFALGTAIGVSATLSAAPVFAQEAGAKPVEEIYVTGSRIGRGSDFESPSPIASFNRDDLSKSGYTNLQQLMEKQPFTGNGTFSTRGNNQDSTANGAASISLRGLGADATLVLVNGRRVAISAFAESITTNFVDINSIPVAAIERIEVLKDGASAVYGSDAVAGVVNIIMRDDFEGFEVSAGGGWTTESGYDETNISAIWGMSGEDSNVTIIADYFKNSTLSNSERENSKASRWAPPTTQPRVASTCARRAAIRGSSSSAMACSNPTTEATVADAKAGRSVLPAGSDRRAVCVFDYGPFNLITPEAERTGLMLMAHQGFGNGLEVFTEIGGTAQQVAGPGRADAARRRRRDSPCRSHIRTTRSRTRDRHRRRSLPDGGRRCAHVAHRDRQPARRARAAWRFQRLELGGLGAACAQRDRAER